MAYEVVKTIGGRQYRYSVQSERDERTGKSRNRWTYVGRVASERAGSATVRPGRGNARQRLLDATERLLETGDTAKLTVDAIVAQAGVAHGTFYRYFRDRSGALEALARHIKASRNIGDASQLDDAVTSIESARAGVRRLVVDRLTYAREHRPSVRAWHALIASDARLAAFREERREIVLRRLHEHIAALQTKGFTDVPDAAATAAALSALVDGVLRASILERDRLDDADIAATADVAVRALFGR